MNKILIFVVALCGTFLLSCSPYNADGSAPSHEKETQNSEDGEDGNSSSSGSDNSSNSSGSSSSFEPSPLLIKRKLIVGGTGAAGPFVDLDPDPPVAYKQAQIQLYSTKIDMFYGATFSSGGDYIYDSYYIDEFLEVIPSDNTCILELTDLQANKVKTATRLSDIENIILPNLCLYRISATLGKAFGIYTSEGNWRFVIITSKNGRIEIEITVVYVPEGFEYE
jgi:hypothetical protein